MPSGFSLRQLTTTTSTLALSVAAACLSGCGGGGGGGGGGSSASTIPAALVSPTGNSDSNYVQPIGASAVTAWSNGTAGGAGVTVGVIDGEIYTSAPGLTGGKVVSEVSYANNTQSGYSPAITIPAIAGYTASSTPSYDHATAVAGWIAGTPVTVTNYSGSGTVEGIAYAAKLRSYDIFAVVGGQVVVPGSYSAGNSIVVNAFAQAQADGVSIVNNSWGSNTSTSFTGSNTNVLSNTASELSQWANNVNAGQVLVWAAGNIDTGSGANNGNINQPNSEPLAPLQNSALTKGWLVVGNYDSSTGALSTTSKPCGAAAAFCILAPGTALTGYDAGKDPGDFIAQNQWTGTSMAAPVVSGALAVVESSGSVSAQTARTIILDTATNMGNSAVNGVGLLNLQAALNHYGVLGVPVGQSVTGPVVSLAGSVFHAGPALGNALSVGFSQQAMPFLDLFGRVYMTSMAGFGQAYAPAGYGSLAVQGMGSTIASLQGGPSLVVGEESHGLSSLTMTEQGNSAVGAQANFGSIAATLTTGMTDTRFTSTGSLGGGLSPAVRDPFLGLSTSGTSLNGFDRNSGIGLTLTSGTDGMNCTPVQSLATSLTVPFGRTGEVRLADGLVTEHDAALGSSGAGALAITGTTTTLFTSVSASMREGIWQLAAGAAMGQSSLQGQEGSLITGFHALSSTAWLEATTRDVVPGTLTVSLSQPLRVEQGSFSMNLAYNRTVDGTLLSKATSINASPTGREADLGVSWSISPFSNTTWGNAVVLRANPGQVAGATPDVQLLSGITMSF